MCKNDGAITLVGYGVSNRALEKYLLSIGIVPSIRAKEQQAGEDYLNLDGEIAFRSPAIRPNRIKGASMISSEACLGLELTKGYKIGVTGSDGKTTTSTLIYKMLEASGKDANLCGNIGTPVIELCPKSSDNTYTVCELSSFQLFDMSPRLDTAVITNISENHLDWHTNMSEYISSKENILLRARRAVICYDDRALLKMSARHKLEYTFFSACEHKAPRGAHMVCVKDGYILYDGKKVLKTDKIRLKGRFNLLNIACAIGTIYESVEIDAIKEVAYTFSGVESRMRTIDIKNGITIIDSSIDSTPTRTASTISALDRSRCVVLLGGYDKGLSYKMLNSALRGIKYAVICGQNAEKIYSEIRGAVRAHITRNFECAVREAYNKCESGDILVLSPASASFDMFENYRQRASVFAQVVRGIK